MEAKTVWMFVPVGLLLLSATIGGITVYAALNDPGFGVEEDYYQKGLDHEAVLEQEQVNLELGWRLELDAAVVAGASLSPATVVLVDQGGEPVTGARITVEAFHLARSTEVARAELVEVEPGLYHADLPLRRTGKWEFRFRVEARGRVYTTVQQPFLFLRKLLTPAEG